MYVCRISTGVCVYACQLFVSNHIFSSGIWHSLNVSVVVISI